MNRLNAARVKAKANEHNRTRAERLEHCAAMTVAVNTHLRNHFSNGGTLEQLKHIEDRYRTPEIPGQHDSISIVRLPLPATQDGLFVIKDLGNLQRSSTGETMKLADGRDMYTIEARDLWAEASAMSFISRYTDIPAPWVYTSCEPDEKDPGRSFITMEYIEGSVYRAGMRLSESQKVSIIRQMAGIRIRMIYITSQLIGGVNWPLTDGPRPNPPHPAGEMSGPRVWDDRRVRSI